MKKLKYIGKATVQLFGYGMVKPGETISVKPDVYFHYRKLNDWEDAEEKAPTGRSRSFKRIRKKVTE